MGVMKSYSKGDEEPPSISEIYSPQEDTSNKSLVVVDAEVKKEESEASFVSKFRTKISKLLNGRSNYSIEDEVAELIEEHDPEGTQVGVEGRSILSNVLKLNDAKISEVMVPRTDIIAVDDKISLSDLKKILLDKEHTRMPVFEESLDKIIGFVHIKDVIHILGSKKSFNIKDVVREILFVPPSMKVLDLLVLMRNKRVHMAVVLDEYGGTDGLVTMEDLMEEIVGEIEDEHDEVETLEIKKIDNDLYEMNARVSVREVEELLDIKLKDESSDEDYETVGGLVFFLLGRVPEKGETVRHGSGYIFEVTDADPRRVKKLIVKKDN